MGQMTMAGGWLMLPILLCSVLGLAIVIERAWALRATRVAPPALTDQLARIARAAREVEIPRPRNPRRMVAPQDRHVVAAKQQDLGSGETLTCGLCGARFRAAVD